MQDHQNQSDLYDYDRAAQPTNEQTITVCHIDESFDFYGGRARGGKHIGNTQPLSKGWLGNPYRLSDGHSRDEAIEKFEEQFIEELRDRNALVNAVIGLPGNRVACHCRRSEEDKPRCHLDVIREKLLDGTVYCIAQEIHDIPICEWKQEAACSWEDLI